MMMKMLEAGGMEVVTDNMRRADDDNPLGYYEFEKVKQIKKDSSWLDSAGGKVFKMVSMLLRDLPLDRKYKIIFMTRNMDEMLESQRKMLERSGRQADRRDDGEMKRIFGDHLTQMRNWLSTQKNFDILYVSYNEVIDNPKEKALAVNRFLNGALNTEKMIEAVVASLYRNRSIKAEGPSA